MKNFLIILASLMFSMTAFSKVYKIERSDQNKVSWTAVGSPGFLKIDGVGGHVLGEVHIEDGQAWGSMSCDLSVFKTGIDTRDEHMHDKYLHTKKYKEAKLVLKKHKIKDQFDFKGMLTLHGVTKEVSGKAKMKKVGDGYKFVANMTIALTDFGIEVPSYLGVTVAKDVDIEVKAAF